MCMYVHTRVCVYIECMLEENVVECNNFSSFFQRNIDGISKKETAANRECLKIIHQ